MDTEFWAILSRAAGQVRTSGARLRLIALELEALDAPALAAFEAAHSGWDHALSDRIELWAAADGLMGGCSDDGFMDFRSWLLLQGRDVVERAVRDPDTLATLDLVETPRWEWFGERELYEKKFGAFEELDFRPPGSAEWPADRLTGYDWTDREIAALFPKIAKIAGRKRRSFERPPSPYESAIAASRGGRRPYAPSATFVEGELLEHTKFGLGVVGASRGDRVDVLFADEKRVLVFRGAPATIRARIDAALSRARAESTTTDLDRTLAEDLPPLLGVFPDLDLHGRVGLLQMLEAVVALEIDPADHPTDPPVPFDARLGAWRIEGALTRRLEATAKPSLLLALADPEAAVRARAARVLSLVTLDRAVATAIRAARSREQEDVVIASCMLSLSRISLAMWWVAGAKDDAREVLQELGNDLFEARRHAQGEPAELTRWAFIIAFTRAQFPKASLVQQKWLRETLAARVTSPSLPWFEGRLWQAAEVVLQGLEEAASAAGSPATG